jgi:RNA polymerase sigma-70 factor (ECF subfamily)
MTDQLQSAIDRFKSGDSSAFNEIVTAHQTAIYRLAYRLTGNAEDAKDLTQEAFIRAYRGLAKFRGQSGLKTWLYQITLNLGASWRRNPRRGEVSLEETGEPASGEREDDGLAEAVRHAVASLPYKQRAAFVMHHYEGFKHDEIAAATGRSAGSVKANYFHAVRKLREQLKEFIS